MLRTSLHRRAESCLGDRIRLSEFEAARAYAERKLACIIEREGDANGLRQRSEYLVQLIAEAVDRNRFSQSLYNAMELQEQETKKDSPCPKTQGRPLLHLYCTALASKMQ